MKSKIFFLIGVTASGKTNFGLKLANYYPFEIISVDSVMIYKFFDIGSGKTFNTDIFYKPHYLIDFLDPNIIYTMSDFCNESLNIIFNIISRKKYPLFIGGSMMYFLSLEKGLSFLPSSNLFIKNKLLYLVNKHGWNYLYYKIKKININMNVKYQIKDRYRLLRFFEILILTGSFLNNFQIIDNFYILKNIKIIKFSLFFNKFILLKKIENRIYRMINLGFVDEVKYLYDEFFINKNFPSIKSIGYKQIYFYLLNKITFDEMVFNIFSSTRKLAKNQITWLKSDLDIVYLNNYRLHFFFDYIKF